MKYSPSPFFLVSVIIVALLVASTYLVGVIWFWQSAQAAEPVTQSVTKDWRPKIRHKCFHPEVNLWDCVRYADAGEKRHE